MKNILALFILLPVFFYSTANAGDFAKQANDNPFLHGELNPLYEGEKTALQGEIVEIKSTKEKYPLYKLNLHTKEIKNIWVTSISPQPLGGIKVGDKIVFKGFITNADILDTSGELRQITHSQTLLLAFLSQRVESL